MINDDTVLLLKRGDLVLVVQRITIFIASKTRFINGIF